MFTSIRLTPRLTKQGNNCKEGHKAERIEKSFGFGCMRLQMKDGKVDTEQTCRMIDTFLENGFNYLTRLTAILAARVKRLWKAVFHTLRWRFPERKQQTSGVSRYRKKHIKT